jgi:hypothetical protein
MLGPFAAHNSYVPRRETPSAANEQEEDEMKKMLILAATIAAALSVGVATSGAASQTPNGYCGALNMLQGGAGMSNAMTVNNANGRAGMSTAVGNSVCG